MSQSIENLAIVKACLNWQDKKIQTLEAKLNATLDDEALADLAELAAKCQTIMTADGATPAPVTPVGPTPVDEPAAGVDDAQSPIDELLGGDVPADDPVAPTV
jgi:hypothetical protein